MYLGRVIGTVVALRKYAGLEGVPLLVVEPLDDKLGIAGEAHVAADATRVAGPRDLVYLVSSREAALALEETFVPVDAAIVGIVDQVSRETSRAEAGSSATSRTVTVGGRDVAPGRSETSGSR